MAGISVKVLTLTRGDLKDCLVLLSLRNETIILEKSAEVIVGEPTIAEGPNLTEDIVMSNLYFFLIIERIVATQSALLLGYRRNREEECKV